jgi:hypothetical protein
MQEIWGRVNCLLPFHDTDRTEKRKKFRGTHTEPSKPLGLDRVYTDRCTDTKQKDLVSLTKIKRGTQTNSKVIS